MSRNDGFLYQKKVKSLVKLHNLNFLASKFSSDSFCTTVLAVPFFFARAMTVCVETLMAGCRWLFWLNHLPGGSSSTMRIATESRAQSFPNTSEPNSICWVVLIAVLIERVNCKTSLHSIAWGSANRRGSCLIFFLDITNSERVRHNPQKKLTIAAGSHVMSSWSSNRYWWKCSLRLFHMARQSFSRWYCVSSLPTMTHILHLISSSSTWCCDSLSLSAYFCFGPIRMDCMVPAILLSRRKCACHVVYRKIIPSSYLVMWQIFLDFECRKKRNVCRHVPRVYLPP